jgi:hypothetical protein
VACDGDCDDVMCACVASTCARLVGMGDARVVARIREERETADSSHVRNDTREKSVTRLDPLNPKAGK